MGDSECTFCFWLLTRCTSWAIVTLLTSHKLRHTLGVLSLPAYIRRLWTGLKTQIDHGYLQNRRGGMPQPYVAEKEWQITRGCSSYLSRMHPMQLGFHPSGGELVALMAGPRYAQWSENAWYSGNSLWAFLSSGVSKVKCLLLSIRKWSVNGFRNKWKSTIIFEWPVTSAWKISDLFAGVFLQFVRLLWVTSMAKVRICENQAATPKVDAEAHTEWSVS